MNYSSSKVLSLDVGMRRIGIAIGDSQTGFIFPREAVDQKQGDPILKLLKIIKEDSISKLVVGLPLNSDSSENDQCKYTRKFADKIIDKINDKESIELIYVNEYGTSLEAKHRFTTMDFDKSIKKGTIDSTSASIILETYFNSIKNNND